MVVISTCPVVSFNVILTLYIVECLLFSYHYHDLDPELILRFYSFANHSLSHFPGDSSADKGEELGHG